MSFLVLLIFIPKIKATYLIQSLYVLQVLGQRSKSVTQQYGFVREALLREVFGHCRHIIASEISFLSTASQLRFEEKGELLKLKLEACNLDEKIFNIILLSKDGDYIIQAQMLADMKPAGW
jgi:hypothetical protein